MLLHAVYGGGFHAALDECMQNYASVIFRGRASFGDLNGKRHAFLVINRHMWARTRASGGF